MQSEYPNTNEYYLCSQSMFKESLLILEYRDREESFNLVFASGALQDARGF